MYFSLVLICLFRGKSGRDSSAKTKLKTYQLQRKTNCSKRNVYNEGKCLLHKKIFV